jgi:hypothetical protein
MIQIKITTGAIEDFTEDKLYNSMRSAGVEHSLAQEVVRMVVHDNNNLASTDILHAATSQALVRKDALAAAARYNLKRAIIDLGPSGYPFEQYIAQIFEAYGYTTKTNQMIRGKCIMHETDVIAKRGNEHYMIECKHHHYAGAKTNAKVALYVYARFLDIVDSWSKQEGTSKDNHRPWLVTNTRASSDAIAYAECVGMKVLAWHYPENAGLNHFIESKRLYPITVLPKLSARAKTALLKQDIILVKEFAAKSEPTLAKLTKLKVHQFSAAYRAAHELLT